MVTTQLDMTYLIIWSLALANVLGAGICIFLARPMSRITTTPYYLLAPVLIALIFFATYQINRDWNDFVGLLFFGLLGVILKTFGWSRPALLIGFFLSSKIELLSYQTSAVYGFSFLTRTGSLILIFVAVVTVWFLLRQKIQNELQSTDKSQQQAHMIVTASFMVFPIAMAIGVLGLDARASLYPMVLSAVLIIFLIFILWSQLRSLQSTRIGTPLPDKVLMRDVFSQDGALWPQLLEFSNLVIFMMLIVIFGFPIATVLFVICFIVHREPTRFVIASLLGFTLVGLMWLLSNLLTLQYPAGWIVNFVNLPWWLSGH